MINVDDFTKQNIKEHNPHQSKIPDHPYRIFVVGGSGSENTSAFINVIKHKPDINKTCLYAKHPYEAKYQFLIKKRESIGLKYLNGSKAFVQYLNNMDDIIKVLKNTIQIKNQKKKKKKKLKKKLKTK